ncbi:Penicillin-insensitive murein endopeptidase precursor [compost metagenome]
MRHLIKILTASSLMLSACAPGGGVGEGFSTDERKSVQVTTYSPPRTTVYKEEQHEVIHGATKVKELTTSYAPDIHRMVLQGEITLDAISNRGSIRVPVDLAGIADSDGYVYLKGYNPKVQQIPGLKIGAKATCIGENFNCSSSFIDIYIELDGKIYHHQVESTPTDASEKKGEIKEDTKHDTGPVAEGEDHENFGEGESEEASTPGRYVGTLDDDIETIFKKDGKPATPDTGKKDEPKKEEPKKDDTKKDDTKKEEPKKDDSKKDDSKKDTPKKEEPKKDEPKKEEPKKEEPAKKTPKPPRPNNDQAIGAPDKGKLERAINLLALEKQNEEAGFKVLRPERKTHYGTSELTYLIALMGQFVKKEIPGMTVYVGDLSLEKGGIWYRGGKPWGHLSHQNGLDVDIPLFFNNKTFQGYFASALAVNKIHPNWMKEEQWEMFKMLVNTKLIDRIFIHKTLKASFCELAIKKGELVKGRDSLASETLRRLRPDTDHHNHFHLRAKCAKGQTRCKQMIDPVNDSGCF